MLVRELSACSEIIAGDGTVLRELLHPAKQAVALRDSLAHAVLPPGRASAKHRLSASEVYYLLEGEGVMHIDAESREVRPGQAVYIPPGGIQWIENRGPRELRFLCIVDPAWSPACEEVME